MSPLTGGFFIYEVWVDGRVDDSAVKAVVTWASPAFPVTGQEPS